MNRCREIVGIELRGIDQQVVKIEEDALRKFRNSYAGRRAGFGRQIVRSDQRHNILISPGRLKEAAVFGEREWELVLKLLSASSCRSWFLEPLGSRVAIRILAAVSGKRMVSFLGQHSSDALARLAPDAPE